MKPNCRRPFQNTLLAAALPLIWVPVSQAAQLVNWDVPTATATTALTSSVAAGLSASPVSLSRAFFELGQHVMADPWLHRHDKPLHHLFHHRRAGRYRHSGVAHLHRQRPGGHGRSMDRTQPEAGAQHGCHLCQWSGRSRQPEPRPGPRGRPQAPPSPQTPPPFSRPIASSTQVKPIISAWSGWARTAPPKT